ncbi:MULTISPECIES: hypothetical protein [Sorangium]|uniref:hypothetical protein n=1 Tax=Sorangium TaxID=39643 RepID=UPI003D9C091E
MTDEGEAVSGAGDDLWQDITTYKLEATWRHDAAFFAPELAVVPLRSPPTTPFPPAHGCPSPAVTGRGLDAGPSAMA